MLIRKQHALNFYFACILTANAVLGTNTGDSLDYPQLKLVRNAKEWIGCCSNEIGCLARDVYPRMMTGLNTIHFIHPSQIPANRTVTYLRIVTNYRPQKENSYRIRFTVGGNRIDYPGNIATPVTELVTVNFNLNITISYVNIIYVTVDIKYYYHVTPMNYFEYMRIQVKHIPQNIVDQYNFRDLIVSDHVLVGIQEGMYDLPQAGIITEERLNIHLTTSSYIPAKHTPGLYTHHTLNAMFTLVINDFGVKYHHKHDALYFLNLLKVKYKITTD